MKRLRYFKNSILTILSILLIFFFMSMPVARAEEKGYSVISAPMVKNLMETTDALLVNVLSELEYEMHHITDSINIPVDKLTSSLDTFPKNKDNPLIFYCMGIR